MPSFRPFPGHFFTQLSKSFVLLAGVSSALSALASEVDSYTSRHTLRDAAPFLNQVVNVWIEEALIDANSTPLIPDLAAETEQQGCDESRLMEALKDRFSGYLVGQLESFVNNSTALDTIHVSFNESIYRDFDFSEAPTVSLTERLAVLLRIGDVYLGSDKLGHFFTEGYSYYERYVAEDYQAAIDYGELTESSYYGELTTGIFSYADLVANLNGFRFWNAVLAKKPDPVSDAQTVQPYIGCSDRKWRRLRSFDWGEYVDPAWDEALNCNAYRNDILLSKAQRRIAQASGGQQCPIYHIDEKLLKEKYGGLLASLYNPRPGRVLQSFNEKFEQYRNDIMRKLNMTFEQVTPGP